MTDTQKDRRAGSMADINCQPMPPRQAEVYAYAPAGWADMPKLNLPDMLYVPEVILRALKDRGLVETRWRTATIREWRRLTLPRSPS